MTDTVKTVKSAGGDYSTLASWNAGQAKTISVGDREIAECYAFLDTTRVDVLGWVVPSGAEIIIRAAAGNQHNGTFGTGYRLESAANYYAPLWVRADYVTVQGISTTYTHADIITASPNTLDVAVSLAGPTKIINCLARHSIPSDSGSGDAAIYCNSPTIIVNTIAIQDNGAHAIVVQAGDYLLYNVTGINLNGKAFRIGYSGTGTVLAKNCYFHSTDVPWTNDGIGTLTVTTSMHSTAQVQTGSTGSKAYSTANFVSVTADAEDLHVVTGSALIAAGTDLSADADYPFSTDIDGDTRSAPWTVGVDHAPAPPPVTPLRMLSSGLRF